MTTALQQEIEQFRDFATRVAATEDVESLQEILDLWQMEHPTDAEQRASLESLRRGLTDAAAGRIRPADDVIADLRREMTGRP
jgi:predicted transcriptional regulator